MNMPAGTVLITGCSPGGIGHSMARQFNKRGYHVIATARSIGKIRDLADLGMTTIPLEVTSEDSIQSCLNEVRKHCPGGLDFLVNNAGRNCTIPALDLDIADARDCFETNVFAIMRLVQVFCPLLMQAKGNIVMIGSLAGVMPYVFGSAYNASKAALMIYSDTLRVELAPFNVSVITVITGGVRSEITKKSPRFIPETSIYAPIKALFERRKVHSAEVGIEPDVFAASVVPQLLPGAGLWPWNRRRWIWAGAKSTLVWFLAAGWWRHGLFDWYFTREFQLDRLRLFKTKAR